MVISHAKFQYISKILICDIESWTGEKKKEKRKERENRQKSTSPTKWLAFWSHEPSKIVTSVLFQWVRLGENPKPHSR